MDFLLDTFWSTAKISPPGKFNWADLIAWGWNLVKFTTPTLAVFFGQLALGVEWKAAGLVALLAFYGALADFFKKLNDGKK